MSTPPPPVGASGNFVCLHPGNVHLLFNTLTATSEYTYLAGLKFDAVPTEGLPLASRYNLVNAYGQYNENNLAAVTISGSEIFINKSAIGIGESRGLTELGPRLRISDTRRVLQH
jgi:hypothetical protein